VDWTRDELAELYRIEHALVQSGLTLDVERGVTDEGDPWFVFCRSDGEVLIHLARYDGLYRLHSPALPAPLIGQSFKALTKAFSNQVPLQVTLKRDMGPRLFVHPAAMLAVVIGTIFVASNELAFSTQPIDSEKKHGDASLATTSHNLKALLQSTFQQYIENFFTWLRDGTFLQQSTYITMISAVAAFIVGSDSATDHARDVLTAGNHTAGDHTNDTALIIAPAPTNDASHRTAETKSVIAQDVSDQSHNTSGTSHTADVIVVSNTSTNSNMTGLQDDPVLAKGHDATNVPELLLATAYFDSSGQSLAGQLSLGLADFSRPHVDLASYLSAAASPGVATDPLKDLTSAVTAIVQNGQSGLNSTSDINNLIAHAIQMSPTDGSQNLITYFLNTNHITSQSLPAAGASPGYSLFDANAATTLESFLEQNPNAQAVFNNKSVVVYDDIHDTTTATIKVWTFTDGSTIAIVGHADHGFVA